ncbi:MAG: 50S ribosomal protein L4 [Candidatus Gracilibacteria bacterium]
MKAPLYNQKGESIGEVPLNETIFGAKMNLGLIQQALMLQEANSRHPIAHTKLRGEVRGGGRKPYKQKHTGRARQGSIRAPHYKGGGVVFGPRNVRNFTLAMPKKQRRQALFSALSGKASDKQIIVLDGYEAKETKSKSFAAMLKKLPATRNTLVIISEKNDLVQKSSRNLENSKTILVNYLNVHDLLKYETLLFFKDALPKAESIFLK